jgi:hypothetical protein
MIKVERGCADSNRDHTHEERHPLMPKTATDPVGSAPDPVAVKAALRAMALGRRSREAERLAHQAWREAAAEQPDPQEMTSEQIDDEMLRLALRVNTLAAEEDRRAEPVWR